MNSNIPTQENAIDKSKDNSLENLRKITNQENSIAALYYQKTNSNHKKVAQYTLTGEFINSYESVREAARILNLDASVISKVCRGIKYKSHGGFIFKYI